MKPQVLPPNVLRHFYLGGPRIAAFRGVQLESDHMPEEWIGAIGNYEHLVAYAQILWPDFVEHDDCVFRAGVTDDIYKGFMAQTKGNKTSVEALINHRHVLD